MHSRSSPTRLQINYITGCAFSILFFVSTLHSSQRTNEPSDFGSECWVKQSLQIECPHYKTIGFFKNQRQLKHDNVPIRSSVFLTFLFNIRSTSALIFYSAVRLESNSLALLSAASSLSQRALSFSGKVFSSSLSTLYDPSISLNSFLRSNSWSSTFFFSALSLVSSSILSASDF